MFPFTGDVCTLRTERSLTYVFILDYRINDARQPPAADSQNIAMYEGVPKR
ncbi:MAG: hypothetical protein AAF827_03990 [Cyanobacteria bacterium P01_D01_bin.6]